MVQKAVCFACVADRGLRPKSRLQKAKRQQGGWRSPVRAQYYPRNTVRWDSLFVNRKLEKSRVCRGEMAGEKGSCPLSVFGCQQERRKRWMSLGRLRRRLRHAALAPWYRFMVYTIERR